MRKIHDLSYEELLNLTPADIENFVKLEMAERGIAPVDDPGSSPQLPFEYPPKTKMMWTCKAIDFYVDDLETISELVREVHDVESRGGVYNTVNSWGVEEEVIQPGIGRYGYTDSLNITSEMFWEKDQLNVVKKMRDEEREIEGEYKEAKEKYDEYMEIKDSIEQEILSVYRSALQKQAYTDKMRNRLEEYHKLAEYNHDIAWSFFLKAYGEEITGVGNMKLIDGIDGLKEYLMGL